MAPPSETLDCRERVERVEAEEVEGVDTERSSSGTASRAREGETLGEGELGRWMGEVTVLEGVSAVMVGTSIGVRCTTGRTDVGRATSPREADVTVGSNGVSRYSHTAHMTTTVYLPWLLSHPQKGAPSISKHRPANPR